MKPHGHDSSILNRLKAADTFIGITEKKEATEAKKKYMHDQIPRHRFSVQSDDCGPRGGLLPEAASQGLHPQHFWLTGYSRTKACTTQSLSPVTSKVLF